MDHVPGIPLKAMRGSFQGDAMAVATLGIALCKALDALHTAGFVHRDVAPDNILIPENLADPVRLLDFDLVDRLGAIGPAGTSIYRPPESETGEPWTAASDIYSLGVVLFELLTGRLPYHMTDDGTQRHPAAPAPDEVDAFGDLVRVCAKAASLGPRDRYRTAQSFLRALQRATRHPVAAGE
jgi:serine/threonine protein kinase